MGLLSVNDGLPGHPEWSWEYWRTQGLDNDTYYIYDAPGGSFGSGSVIGIGSSREEAVECAEAEALLVRVSEEKP